MTGMISFEEPSSTVAQSPQIELSGSDRLQNRLHQRLRESHPKGALLTHDTIFGTL